MVAQRTMGEAFKVEARNFSEPCTSIVSDTWSFDPLTTEWKSLDNSQGKILFLAKHNLVAISETHALVFGGLDSTLTASSLMYSLPRHPLEATWTRLAPTPDPIPPRAGILCLHLQTPVFLFCHLFSRHKLEERILKNFYSCLHYEQAMCLE